MNLISSDLAEFGYHGHPAGLNMTARSNELHYIIPAGSNMTGANTTGAAGNTTGANTTGAAGNTTEGSSIHMTNPAATRFGSKIASRLP